MTDPMKMDIGEMSIHPVAGEEDFTVEGIEWVGPAQLLVTIEADGKMFSETYDHSVTERLPGDGA